MEVRVLGALAVVGADGEVRLPGRKERALLAMLAANSSASVPADLVIEDLWGDRPPATAERTLAAYVARLRGVLGSQAIVRRGEGWQLIAEAADLDSLQHDRLLSAASAAVDAGDHAAALPLLGQADRLWRGAAFEGHAELALVRTEAERLREARCHAQELHADALLAVGQVEESVRLARDLTARSPLRERGWATLIRSLFLSGQQAEALEAYRRVAGLLADELGVDPGPELRAVHAAVLRHDVAALSPGRAAAAELPAELSGRRPLMLGRADELARLRALWREAVSGAARLVVVSGPAGVGKTTLLTELAVAVAREGGPVRYARARLDDALRREVQAGPGPLLVVVDDLAPRAGFPAELAPGVLVVAAASTARPPVSGADQLELAPLEPDAVRHIVTGYGLADAEAERVVAAAAGSPARAQQLAAEAAAELAAAVAPAIEQLRVEQRVTAETRRRLSAGLLASQRRSRGVASAGSPRPPYPGLEPYDESDADCFAGRDHVVAEITAQLALSSVVVVIGPSGCGKSSVVRAGVVPALRGGALPGSEQWHVVVTAPSAAPPVVEWGPSHLLVLDQLEELWSGRQEVDAARFEALLEQARRAGAKVLATLRSDFFAEAVANPTVAQAVSEGAFLLRPMDASELRAAVTEPAQAVGSAVEPALVEAVLEQMRGEPGALPLLSTALRQTWDRDPHGALRLEAYEEVGGVAGALTRLGEQAYGSLGPADRGAARRLLLRLAVVDEQGRRTRRRIPLDQARPPGDEAAAAALEALAVRRLVVVDGDAVEVAHEAVLTGWPRLDALLEENALTNELRLHLATAAVEWQRSDRDAAELYRGPRLAAAGRLLDDPEALLPVEQAFLTASVEAAEAERFEAVRRARRDRVQARRLRALLAGALALLVLAVAAGVVARHRAQEARAAALTADANRLGANALVEPRTDLALLEAAQAVDLRATVETQASLLDALARRSSLQRVVLPTGARLYAVGVDPSGATVAVGDGRGRLAFVSRSSWSVRGPAVDLGTPYPVFGLAWSPAGDRVAAVVGAAGGGGELVVVDARTGQVRTRLATPSASRVVWAGGHVVVSGPGGVVLVDPVARAVRRLAAAGQVVAASERTIALVEGSRIRWVTPRGQQLAAADLPAAVTAAAASGGDAAAVGTADAVTVIGVDARRVLRIEPGGASALAVDADGRAVARVQRGAVTVSGSAAQPLLPAQFTGAAISLLPDASALGVAARDGLLLEVDLTGQQSFARTRPPLGPPRAVALLADDLVVGGGSGSLQTSAGARGQVTGDAVAVATSPDDRQLAVVSGRTRITALDGRLRALGSWDAAVPRVTDVAYAADDVVLAGSDGRVTRTAALTGKRQWEAALGARVDRLAVDEAAGVVAASRADGQIDLLDARSGRLLREVRTGDAVAAAPVAWDAARHVLWVGRRDGSVQRLDGRTGRVLGASSGHANRVSAVAVGPEGRWAASVAADGSVVVWSGDGHRLGQLPVSGVRFALVGTGSLETLDSDGGILSWPLSVRAWQSRVCAVVGRPLSRAEWGALLDRPYRPAC